MVRRNSGKMSNLSHLTRSNEFSVSKKPIKPLPYTMSTLLIIAPRAVIAPYLFILSLEYLSPLIKLNTANDFHYHPKCEPLKLTHLAFADDLMLFSRADEGSIKILMDAMDEFGKTTGLKLNVLKSNIYLAGVKEYESRGILDLSHLTRGDSPFRYLGVPIVAESMKVMHYSPLLKKLRGFINGWNAKRLFAGLLPPLTAAASSC